MLRNPVLNPESSLRFKALFENERQKLLFSGRLVNEQFEIQTDELMDEVDFTSFEVENQMRMRLRSREALYLKKIEESLDRINDGTFGLCRACEESIELKRLEARPTTTLCLNCKEEEERQERIHIDGHKSKSLGARIRLA